MLEVLCAFTRRDEQIDTKARIDVLAAVAPTGAGASAFGRQSTRLPRAEMISSKRLPRRLRKLV